MTESTNQLPLKRVGLLTMGCARNLVDSEVALGSLIASGYEYASDVSKSDIAIINTCGFTEDAKKESLDAILGLAKLKQENKIKKLVVMGCLSQRYSDELSKEMPEIDIILGTNSFEELPGIFAPIQLKQTQKVVEVVPRPQFLLNQFSNKKQLTPKHTSYIKISEGCINACSYCAIPKMKGKHRSRPVDDIVQEAKKMAEGGLLKEINLIGQDTAAYGYDLEKKFLLDVLLDRLATELPDVWIRNLYAHPAHVTDEMISVIQKHKNICSYIDLPIEHSHPDMLKRMNRGVSRETMDQVIYKLRDRIPNLTLRTAIIVGFPGESDEEFQDLLNYLTEIRFERLGTFIFSQEDGTRAYSMLNQIPQELKEERFHQLMELQSEITSEWNEKRIGKTLKVLVDDKDASQNGLYLARSEADAPEVDGQVFIQSSNPLAIGDFLNVQITDALEHDLIGIVAK